MIFQRFEEEGLAHFSYLVGDRETRQAVVIDPRRDVDVYLEWMDDRDLVLKAVLETHIHADYASGAPELAYVTEVPHYISHYDQNEEYEATFPHQSLEDKDRIQAGALSFDVLHTPGHTPEHVSFLLYEQSNGQSEPVKLFSGDFLFVGSLGRPDLIGEESKRRLAGRLFESVRKIKAMPLPEDLSVHPAHGSGSLCGAGLSEAPESTLGEERSTNPYFSMEDREEFIERLLGSLGDYPPYYRRMKETNSQGPAFVQPVLPPPATSVESFHERVRDDDAVVLDLRDEASFGRGHIPGALNLGLSPNINRWAPWVIPYDRPIYLVGDDSMGPGDMEQVLRRLLRVELDRVEGYLEGGYPEWSNAGYAELTIRQYDPRRLADELRGEPWPLVLDVRTAPEFDETHLVGARHLMVGQIPDRLDELPDDRDRLVITYCSSGYRSSLAASLLRGAGYENVGHLSGGFKEWVEEGGEVSEASGGR